MAIKLPIILHRSVRLSKTGGQIIINSNKLRTGMIHIGNENYGFQHKYNLTIWEQQGGTVVFEDGIELGKGTCISIGKNAFLKLEHNVRFGGDVRLICMKSVIIRSNTMLAWDVHIMDTDFHATFNTITNAINAAEKPIIIGKNNWLCLGSLILKGSITPDYCIVSAKTVINRDYSAVGENIILSNDTVAKVVAKAIQCDFPYKCNM